MKSFILILVLLDVIPEITFAICVFSRFQSNLLSDFRSKSDLNLTQSLQIIRFVSKISKL